MRHEAPQNAAALTYTTLLSLVPLMTVMLAVLSAFPVADRVNEIIQDFVFKNFVPTSGELLQQYLLEFSAKASSLTGTGAVFLVIVALMMMATIDRALNVIWEVQAKRSFASKFLIYWAVLSFGPVLIGASVLVTSYLVSLPILSEAASSGMGRSLLGLTPVSASALAFTMMYAVVPNRRVRMGHALIGGIFAAVLFEMAKRGFAFYITQFPTYRGDLWRLGDGSDLPGLVISVMDRRVAGCRGDPLSEYLPLEGQRSKSMPDRYGRCH